MPVVAKGFQIGDRLRGLLAVERHRVVEGVKQVALTADGHIDGRVVNAETLDIAHRPI